MQMTQILELMTKPLDDLSELLQAGGAILWVILFATIIMWMLILERYAYYYFQYPRLHQNLLEQWQQREDHNSWTARKIREYVVAETNGLLIRHLLPIRTLTTLLPLLGLLGTVTGMIQVFDVLAIFGTGNARALAQGISQALITTMAGLTTALSGLYFSALLDKRAEYETRRLAHKMRLQ